MAALVHSRHSVDLMAGKTVLVASNRRSHLQADEMAMKRLQLEVAGLFTEGAQVMSHLAENPCDLIICDGRLEDMDASTFLRLIKQNAQFKHIPVVVVSRDNQREVILDVVAMGCSGYVLRPYVVDALESHILNAFQSRRLNEMEKQPLKDAAKMTEAGNLEDAIDEFTEVLERLEEAQKYYDLGCRFLMDQDWGRAIAAFQKAIRINEMYAEAYEGLARAYQAKGDKDKQHVCVQKAAEIYAQFDHMEKVKELFVEILKHDDKAANPFNTLGLKLRKQGDLPGAVRAYKQAIELTPDDENVHFNIAKAFVFMGRSQEGVDHLDQALRINPAFPEARMMFQKVSGQNWKAPDGAGRAPEAPHESAEYKDVDDAAEE